MAGRRGERQQQQRREALERAMARVEQVGLDAWAGEGLTPASVNTRAFPDPESLFFHDHGDWVEGFREVLERGGLVEACMALARHMEEDREHWLRRLRLVAAEPRLLARKARLELDVLAVLAAHFRRWGAAGAQGERVAAFEAASVMGVLQGAERMWVEGGGRPVLPVLMQEGLAVVWPGLYAHARRHS